MKESCRPEARRQTNNRVALRGKSGQNNQPRGGYPNVTFGRLTQWLECHLHTVEVAGSNPAPPIPKDRRLKNLGRHAT